MDVASMGIKMDYIVGLKILLWKGRKTRNRLKSTEDEILSNKSHKPITKK